MRRQVYVVDDDAHVRRSTCFLLDSHGYECHPFADGNAFLSEIDRLAPGCVLLDLLMPGSSGFEVQEELAQRGLHLPVIAMTGHPNDEASQRSVKLGAIRLLAKPFAEETLLSALEVGFAGLNTEARAH